jgi:hypothetical protein
MTVPCTTDGRVWITHRRSGTLVGSFQVTLGAVYSFPSHAKTSKCKRRTFQKLAQVFKDFGQHDELLRIQ